MKNGILSLMAWSLPFLLIAQSYTATQSMETKEGPAVEGKGIHWTTGLSWEQIKQKAKQENKYIFIDAYTTWCGPCKAMDKYVYPNDTVGDFFNQHFISVKAQMDVTDKDDQRIRDWYDDATTIRTEYVIDAFPSFIFLSPEGKIVYKEQGYRPVKEFVSIGKVALKPGRIYTDPYKEYNRLVAEYKKGIKHYDSMPTMIRTAFRINDGDFAREMFKDHFNYASALNEGERYTKDNIDLWSSVSLKLDSKILQFFLKDYDKIDQVMGQKGWSMNVVDEVIQRRIVDSFFRMQKGMTTTTTGKKVPNSEIMFMKLPVRLDGKIDPDYVEADWKKLKKMIREHFNEDFASRNVSMAKIVWYYQHQNKLSYVKTYFSRFDKYPPADLTRESVLISAITWDTFLYTNDKKLLKRAIEWLDKIIQHGFIQPYSFDTYANLLYKLGRTSEAIEWEEKALNLTTPNSKNNKLYKQALEQMKKGEATYLDDGAIWPKEKNKGK